MEVVLREDVESLGLRGEIVNVARGYARNYLLPRGMAELATPGLVKELERRDALRARHEAQTSDEAQSIATRLEAAELRFDVKAGVTGSLFGSVTATNVADRLWDDLKIRIDRRKLDVGTIKRIGRYTIPVAVFGDVTAELRLLVVPEGGELPPDEEIAAAEAAEAAAAGAQAPAAAPDEVEATADELEPPSEAGATAETEAQPVETGPAEADVEPEAAAADTEPEGVEDDAPAE
jgi:large subunit ribosomal protein L9